MNCPKCGNGIGDAVDQTYSNYASGRVAKQQHTGDIYYCEECEVYYIDDLIEGRLRRWNY